MAQQKIRLMTEQALTDQVPALVGDALQDDPTISQALADSVGDLASQPEVLGATFPTIPNARRMSIAHTGAVVLILDDGRVDNYELALPAVEAVGGRLTLAVTSDWVGNADFGTVAQLRDAAARGHEIGWHGKAHINMTSLTPAERAVEWSGKEVLEGYLAGVTDIPVTTAVYPGNFYSEETNREAFGRFERVFTGNVLPFMQDPRAYDGRFLRGRWGWAHDSAGQSRQKATLDFIRQAADQRSIVTIYGHKVNSATPGNNPTNELQELCALTAELGIPIVTARDAFPAPPQFAHHGFEEADLNSTRAHGIYATNATNVVESVIDAPQAGYPGSRSLRISGDGTTYPRLHIMQSAIPTTGAPMTISGRVKMVKNGGTGPGAGIVVEQRGALNEDLGLVTGPMVNATQGWGQYRLDFTPHPECTHIRVRLGLDRVAGEVYFDHLHVGETRYGALG